MKADKVGWLKRRTNKRKNKNEKLDPFAKKKNDHQNELTEH